MTKKIAKLFDWRFLLIFLALLSLRVPFYLTKHIQEDAYIFFRTAKSLVETGVYGFNLGEKVSSATSHLYVFYLSLLRLSFKDVFINIALVLNTILFLIGLYLVINRLLTNHNQVLILWGLVGALPIALLISYSGMETSLLIFVIGFIVYFLSSTNYRYIAYFGLFILPWIRPDALIYGIFLILYGMTLDTKNLIPSSISLGIGLLSLLFFNLLYFGALINQTIIAKSSAYHPGYTVQEILHRIVDIFWSSNAGGVFSPLTTKYFDSVGRIFFLIFLIVFCVYLYKNRGKKYFGFICLCFGLSFVIPAIYASGGVVFPWYLWPSTLFAFLIISAFFIEYINQLESKSRWLGFGMVIITTILLSFIQWTISFNWGLQERYYRGGIGEYINSVSNKEDKILLEPAGYIPYFADRYTYDEIGLVTPLVTAYRERFKGRWWVNFLIDYRPDFLVERSPILQYLTLDGYKLNDGEVRWFNGHYVLLNQFHYDPNRYVTNNILLAILAFGTASDYYLYKYIE
jgi:hypothetical protein